MNAFQRAKKLACSTRENGMYRKVQHEPNKTLVIIDMQNEFMRKKEYEIVPAICSLIRHAKHHGWAIIVVEYNGYGETDEEIQEILVEYPHWTTIYKRDSDGSQEVIECIKANPAWSMDLLVCGIYGPDCVAQTVRGLFQESDLVEVAVVTDAVYPDYYSCTEELENGAMQEREVKIDDIVDCNPLVLSQPVLLMCERE